MPRVVCIRPGKKNLTLNFTEAVENSLYSHVFFIHGAVALAIFGGKGARIVHVPRPHTCT